jgi:hypothetical protein
VAGFLSRKKSVVSFFCLKRKAPSPAAIAAQAGKEGMKEWRWGGGLTSSSSSDPGLLSGRGNSPSACAPDELDEASESQEPGPSSSSGSQLSLLFQTCIWTSLLLLLARPSKVLRSLDTSKWLLLDSRATLSECPIWHSKQIPNVGKV